MNFLSQLSKERISGKTCLLRINLDITDPARESYRLEAVVPTIKFLLDADAKITILSHRGRPSGPNPALSLKPVVDALFSKLNYGSLASIDWIENLRFDTREEQNDPGFAQELAGKGDFYVNDDFATSHRAHASITTITQFLTSYAGLLLEKEVANLSRLRDNPEGPLVLIIGGNKIEDKEPIMENFKYKSDQILLGGAYFNPPTLDIDQETIAHYCQAIAGAKTIIWNGPLGQVEDPRYVAGTKAVAEAIAQATAPPTGGGAFSVVGGGDTLQFLQQFGLLNKFSFVSTGGGAMLKFLSGQSLPGLTALEKS